jgi:putative transposase
MASRVALAAAHVAPRIEGKLVPPTVMKTHRIKLNPTPSQENYFLRACGTARFAYNWGLAALHEMFAAGEQPSANKIKKQFNKIKRKAFPWVYDVTKCAAEAAFADLGTAFANYFRKRKEGNLPKPKPSQKCRKDGKPLGYPRFKSKKRSKNSFYLSNDQFKVNGHWVRVPKLGWVNILDTLRFNGKIMSARITSKAGRWYISIVVEVPIKTDASRNNLSVGIDLGINKLATLSTGKVFENQKVLRQQLSKLKRLNRQLSRRQKGSRRWEKTKRKLQRLHERIANQRQDYIHKMTTWIAKNYGFIATEDLNVAGMVRNRLFSCRSRMLRLAKSCASLSTSPSGLAEKSRR